MAAEGLSWLMEEEQTAFLHPEIKEGLFITDADAIKCMVVFLPNEPYWMLTTLRITASLLSCSVNPLPVLILSHSPATWLWQTLQKQVSNHHCLGNVRSVASDLSCSQLAMILRSGMAEYPLLKQQSFEEKQARGKYRKGLTKRELDAVAGLFCGSSVSIQAKHLGISRKTLYSQRKSGIKKMVHSFPSLRYLSSA